MINVNDGLTKILVFASILKDEQEFYIFLPSGQGLKDRKFNIKLYI